MLIHLSSYLLKSHQATFENRYIRFVKQELYPLFIWDFLTEKPSTEWEVSDHNLIPFWVGKLKRAILTINRSMGLQKGTYENDGIKFLHGESSVSTTSVF